MRRVLIVLAVVTAAWYGSNRQRRDRLRHAVQAALPPSLPRQVQGLAKTLGSRVKGNGAPAGAERDASPTTGMEQAPPRDQTAILERTSGAYIGNTKTRLFHRADAPHLPAEEHRVYFISEEEARAAGFEPAQDEGLERTES
jgi:hypothetical protein